MNEPVPARCYNFAAVSIERKRAWIEGQPGAAAVHSQASSLAALGEHAASANQDLARHLDGLQVDWRGPASEASQAQLRSAGAGMDATTSVASNGSGRLNDYGDSFSTMASQVVYDDPAKAGWVDSFTRSNAWQAAVGVLDSRLSFDEQNQVNSAQADHALTVHAANTSDVAARFTTDTGPGARWPGDVPPGSGPGVGGGAGAGSPSSGVSTPGAASAFAPAGPVTGASTGGSGGVGASVVPVRIEPLPPRPPAPQGLSPSPPPSSTPPSAAGAVPGVAAPGVAPSPRPGGPDPLSGPTRPSASRPHDARWSAPAPQPTAPRGDPGAESGADRAARFASGLRNRQMPTPRPPGAGSAGGVPPARGAHPTRGGVWGGAGGRGSAGGGNSGGVGGSGPTGGGGAGAGPGGPAAGGGARWWGGSGDGRGPARLPEPDGHGPGGRGPGGRSGPVEASGAGGRAAERGTGGYGPMMGGAGAGQQADREHRNRYDILSDEAFVTPLAYTDAVLGPDQDERR